MALRALTLVTSMRKVWVRLNFIPAETGRRLHEQLLVISAVGNKPKLHPHLSFHFTPRRFSLLVLFTVVYL